MTASMQPTLLRAQETPPLSTPQSDPALGDMEAMPGIGVDWPDLNAAEPVVDPQDSAATDIAAPPPVADPSATENTDPAAGDPGTEMADDGSERRYEIIINGVDDITDSVFRSRFNELSLLNEGKGKPAILAQINRRMKQDTQVLDRLLRAKGYYDARIRPSIIPPPGNDGGKLAVTFDIVPGQLYTLSRVSLSGLESAAARAPAIRTAFPVEVGSPVNADAILAAQAELSKALGESGFPFAKVDEPVVEIDHDTRLGELDMTVAPGGFRQFGDIIIREGPKRIFTARHLQRIARFHPGDTFAASDVEDLRRAIVATGLVSSVDIKPVEAGDATADGGHVNMEVALTPAPMRTIAGEAGYGTGEGYRLEVSWQHRNFFPPEGAVTVRGLIGTKEQLLGLTYRRNNFKKRDRVLTASFVARHENLAAYSARTISLSGSLERQTNIIFQKKWVWSLGAELLASREKDLFGGQIVRGDRTYFIAALPTSLTYDGSDDLLNPTRGFRLGARISPEISAQGSTFGYARAQIDGSLYVPTGEKLVIASRVRVGSIIGSNVDRIAPSRRFYAGGGASVRGYGFQAIGPRDANNDPVGGKSLVEFSLEARVRVGNFGIVPFIDAGNISTHALPRLSSVRYGAGIGARYYSSFGPIRVDVGTPLNRQPGDSRIAVYVSLGQAF